MSNATQILKTSKTDGSAQVLLEAPFDPIRRQMNSVLLTIDLTKAVADEAIERKDCVVVSYRMHIVIFYIPNARLMLMFLDPIIFRGFKALTLADTQQQSLLRLALEGISVYSPHTAVDAVPGGLGDWLADIVTGTLPSPEPSTHTAVKGKEPMLALEPEEKADKSDKIGDSGEQFRPPEKLPSKPIRPSMAPRASTYSKPTYPKPADSETKIGLNHADVEHTRSTIRTIKGVDGFESAGMGRLIRYRSPQPLTHLIERIAHGVGSPKGFPVAIPQKKQVEDIQISSVGVCAGSGHDVLRECDADLLFTGELSHHEALRLTEQGRCVVTLFHSNSERGFLSNVLKEKLAKTLKEEWERVRNESRDNMDGMTEFNEHWEDALKDEDVLVEVSEVDRDPFGIVILQSDQKGRPLS